MLRILKIILISLTITTLIGCNKPNPNILIVGTISGPETELMETAQKVAKERYNLTIKIVEFNDYALPNEALQNGSIDANVYQHKPYLDSFLKTHKYNFEIIGKTFIYPQGIYAKNLKNLKNLPNKAIIAIPNDPSNELRALKLLESTGLITLKDNGSATLDDIIENPKNIRFKELDAAQLPRILDDVDAAVINTTFAIPAGLSPVRDALVIENKDSPYANLIVIKSGNPKTEQLEILIKSLHSPEVQNTAKEIFGDGAITAW